MFTLQEIKMKKRFRKENGTDALYIIILFENCAHQLGRRSEPHATGGP
jgi:hypothetical protein